MAQGLIADEAHINERMGKLHGQSDTRDLERIPYQKGLLGSSKRNAAKPCCFCSLAFAPLAFVEKKATM